MVLYETILFDLDGTLVDPKIAITKAAQYALSKFNIVENDLDKLEPFIGPPLAVSFQKYYSFDGSKTKQAVELYREHFSKYGVVENTVYPGIVDLLGLLHNRGQKLVLATSKLTLFAEKILKHVGIYDYFTGISGGDFYQTQASKKEIIHSALSKLPTPRKQTAVMIGDREYDIIGAQQNGIDSIGVTYGYGSIEEIKKAGPTYLVNAVEELKTLLVE